MYDADEAMYAAIDYVNQPGNWPINTPEKVRFAEIDAFLAGYKFAKEEENND